jgi:Flp pilus assembly protein TadG
MRKLLTKILRSARADGGTAATEFALILPLLATIVVSLPDLSQVATGVLDMESATRASIQYAMAGGSDMSVAHDIGMTGWDSKPQNASLTASEACLCGGTAGTCGQVCPDGTNPQTYITVVASGRVGGSMIAFEHSISRSVRVQ